MSRALEIFTRCESGDELHQAWTRLASSPFEHPDWLLTWWEHFGCDADLMIAALRDDGEQISSLAPLFRNDNGLRLLGGGVACSDHQQLLIGEANDQQTARFVRDLTGTPEFSQSHLYLESIDQGSPTEDALGNCGAVLKLKTQAVGSAFLELPSDWDSYLSSLSKNHRKRCRRWWRKHFESEATRRISTRHGWNKASALQTLTRLHKQRRSALQQSESDSFADAKYVDFLKDAFNRLSSQSITTTNGVSKPMAEISGLMVGDKVVAAEFELHSASRVAAYQSGMCPDHMSDSMGAVSVLWRIHTAIQDGQTVYDFGRGLEDYKFHWGAKVSQAADYRVWPATVEGRVRLSSRRVLQTAKQFARLARNLVVAK